MSRAEIPRGKWALLVEKSQELYGIPYVVDLEGTVWPAVVAVERGIDGYKAITAGCAKVLSALLRRGRQDLADEAYVRQVRRFWRDRL